MAERIITLACPVDEILKATVRQLHDRDGKTVDLYNIHLHPLEATAGCEREVRFDQFAPTLENMTDELCARAACQTLGCLALRCKQQF